MPKLTPKRERFCQEYVIDLNATQAALRAEYSPKTAKQIGSRLLTYVDVSDRITELQAKVATKLEITAERVLNGLAQIGFFDIRKLYHADGRLKEPHELDDATANAIVAIEAIAKKTKQGGRVVTTKIRAGDKLGALETLAKHLGLINEKLQVTLDDPAKRVHFVTPDNGRAIQQP